METQMSKLRRTLFLPAFLLAAVAVGQQMEDGIPVTDAMVIAKCGACHMRDERGLMQRISWVRATPEGWQETFRKMVLGHGLALTAEEGRTILKYLTANHGLAPEEAKAISYDAERRMREEEIPDASVSSNCTRCHSVAKALSRRRSAAEWETFAKSHAQRFKIPAEETVSYLTATAPLHSPAWAAWSKQTNKASLAGRWLITAFVPGHGSYYGELQADADGDTEFNTKVTLKSVRDGSTLIRAGRSAVYGNHTWRGRSKGSMPPASLTDLANETREALEFSSDQNSAQGRWFWGQYQEFGFDVKLRRPGSGPTLLLVEGAAIKPGSRANRLRLIGEKFPAELTARDLNLGAGVTVRAIVSHTASEVVVDVDAAANAPLGKHDVTVAKSIAPGALAVYDRVDYIKLTPQSALASFADQARKTGYQQFDAVGYQRGPDGRARTADDVELGSMEVDWSIEVFYEDENPNRGVVGSVSSTGLFTPASKSLNTNVDLWVIATAKKEKDNEGEPLVAKAYLVLTVPMYTFNGRQYVRDLDRWVDGGPAPAQLGDLQ
jgi:quinohemoprotein amine dehydrogenase